MSDAITTECRLCGAAGPHEITAVREMLFGTRERFDYYSCAACGTLQIVNLLSDEELSRHYPPEYYSFNVSTQPRIRQWLSTQQDRFEMHTGGRLAGAVMAAAMPERLFRMLGRLALRPDARILDVGCGGGELLDRLARAGFTNLFGADPFIAADGQTPLGVPLMKQFLSDVPGEFDLIMFNHSLEHVPDPISTLKAAHARLAAGGSCLVRVPTPSSEAWDIYRADWIQIDAPRHIVIPSRKGLALAAQTAGLRVENTIDDSSAFQFLGSELYRRDLAWSDVGDRKIFGQWQMWSWDKRAERLNRESRGDQTGFVLRAQTA